MSDILAQAADMCQNLVQVSQQSVVDAALQVQELEDAYSIRLEAHELLIRNAHARCEEIQNQFRINGRAALQIGTQLEFAERKRQRCESTSILIRRWWILESLAEQEASSGEPLKVEDEVGGAIPINSCRMDPLFLRDDTALEAARALQQLRLVLKSRSNNNTATANHQTGAWEKSTENNTAARRFELTASLVDRTSVALEQRLLNKFSKLYGKGGKYDFSPQSALQQAQKKASGIIAWQELRDLAQALQLFDHGRHLHLKYVELVVSTRFPELFDPATRAKLEQKKLDEKLRKKMARRQARIDQGEELDSDDENSEDDFSDEEEFDMDATRAKLSSLFHRVSEVFMEEFQLIAYVFGRSYDRKMMQSLDSHSASEITEDTPLTVARALCTRVIGDPHHGLSARIQELLDSIDKRGDFDTGAKKLDTFVVLHEKAAGLFALLQDAAERLLRQEHGSSSEDPDAEARATAARKAVDGLKAFLSSQEAALNNSHRSGYLNLELRLLHHECCHSLGQVGCVLLRPAPTKVDKGMLEKGLLEEYKAPLCPLDKTSLVQYNDILAGPLKPSVLRQPLIHATDSLARARLMFGANSESTARVVTKIYNQMCTFYGPGYLVPVVEAISALLKQKPPTSPPSLPFDEDQPAHDLGVDPAFWVALERIHSAAKVFDRELWAEPSATAGGTKSSSTANRVYDILTQSGSGGGSSGSHPNATTSTNVDNSISVARECRVEFFVDLEQRGEGAILKALDAISAHVQWILVQGGENTKTGGAGGFFSNLSASNTQGPYAMPQTSESSASSNSSSPAVKSLTFCLRHLFVHVQAALSPPSTAAFWTALSMRLYDILVTRLLQNYNISTAGAVIFARDVEALRSVALLAGNNHKHWDLLRELITLYMTPPDALKVILIGADGSGGLFHRAGRDQAIVFMSRRVDYRTKLAQGMMRKSAWVTRLLQDDLNVRDPTDGVINIAMFAAENVR